MWEELHRIPIEYAKRRIAFLKSHPFGYRCETAVDITGRCEDLNRIKELIFELYGRPQEIRKDDKISMIGGEHIEVWRWQDREIQIELCTLDLVRDATITLYSTFPLSLEGKLEKILKPYSTKNELIGWKKELRNRRQEL